MISDSRTYRTLTYAGTLPFLASAVFAANRPGSVSRVLPAEDLASSYGLAILSFLCGTHWATYSCHHEILTMNLLIISNIVVVAVWVAYLIPVHAVLTLGMQIIAFAFLLYVDRSLLQSGVISDENFKVRLQATIIAIILFSFAQRNTRAGGSYAHTTGTRS